MKNNTANAFYPGFTEKIWGVDGRGLVGSLCMCRREEQLSAISYEKSRLQIPLNIFDISDAIHSDAMRRNNGASAAINLTCSFDADGYKIARQTAKCVP
ncbi:MAG: hypothetical protein ACLUE2_06700 [Bacteroides cellulosilyticus]